MRAHAASLSSRLAVKGGCLCGTMSLPIAMFPADEIEAVARALQSRKVNYWTGNEGRQFEAEFAAFTVCEHAVALANGNCSP